MDNWYEAVAAISSSIIALCLMVVIVCILTYYCWNNRSRIRYFMRHLQRKNENEFSLNTFNRNETNEHADTGADEILGLDQPINAKRVVPSLSSPCSWTPSPPYVEPKSKVGEQNFIYRPSTSGIQKDPETNNSNIEACTSDSLKELNYNSIMRNASDCPSMVIHNVDGSNKSTKNKNQSSHMNNSNCIDCYREMFTNSDPSMFHNVEFIQAVHKNQCSFHKNENFTQSLYMPIPKNRPNNVYCFNRCSCQDKDGYMAPPNSPTTMRFGHGNRHFKGNHDHHDDFCRKKSNIHRVRSEDICLSNRNANIYQKKFCSAANLFEVSSRRYYDTDEESNYNDYAKDSHTSEGRTMVPPIPTANVCMALNNPNLPRHNCNQHVYPVAGKSTDIDSINLCGCQKKLEIKNNCPGYKRNIRRLQIPVQVHNPPNKSTRNKSKLLDPPDHFSSIQDSSGSVIDSQQSRLTEHHRCRKKECLIKNCCANSSEEGSFDLETSLEQIYGLASFDERVYNPSKENLETSRGCRWSTSSPINSRTTKKDHEISGIDQLRCNLEPDPSMSWDHTHDVSPLLLTDKTAKSAFDFSRLEDVHSNSMKLQSIQLSTDSNQEKTPNRNSQFSVHDSQFFNDQSSDSQESRFLKAMSSLVSSFSMNI